MGWDGMGWDRIDGEALIIFSINKSNDDSDFSTSEIGFVDMLLQNLIRRFLLSSSNV